MTTTDPDAPARLAAEGFPIVLRDGSEVRLRYGFRGILMLEDAFGGIANVKGAVSPDLTGAALRPMTLLLAAGLVGVQAPDGRDLSDVEVVIDYFDHLRYSDYLKAAGQALTEAFPTPPPAAGAATNRAGRRAASRGTTGSTSAQSSSAGPTPSSGA